MQRVRGGFARRIVPILLIALLASACIQAPVEVDTTTILRERITAATSFALVPPPTPHPEIGPYIEEEIRDALTSKGLAEVALEQADLAVNYRAVLEQKERTRTRSDVDTMSYRVREQYVEKTVEVDVFDARSREVLWRGVARIDVVSRWSFSSAAAKAAREILAEFPAGG